MTACTGSGRRVYDYRGQNRARCHVCQHEVPVATVPPSEAEVALYGRRYVRAQLADHEVPPRALAWHRQPSQFHAAGYVPGLWVADSPLGEYRLHQQHDRKRGRTLKRMRWVVYLGGHGIDSRYGLADAKLRAEADLAERTARQLARERKH